MRKLVLLGALAAILSVSALAQLRVVNSGQVQIGSCSSSTSSPAIIINPSLYSKTDTLATFRLIGDNCLESGARIAFGNRKEVLVANNSSIPGIKKTYVLDDQLITNRIDTLSTCFVIKNDGEIKLISAKGVKTNNAFVVDNSGKLDIEVLRGSVELSNDTINNGGQLIIKASEVLLDNGFKVDKGAQLNCEIF